MQNNHVYVEDSGKGKVTVYDDEGKIKPELKFYYIDRADRATARQKAEYEAAKKASILHCAWGTNYEGR